MLDNGSWWHWWHQWQNGSAGAENVFSGDLETPHRRCTNIGTSDQKMSSFAAAKYVHILETVSFINARATNS